MRRLLFVLVYATLAVPAGGHGIDSGPNPSDAGTESPSADPALPPESNTWLPVGAFALREGAREVEVRTFAAHSHDDEFEGFVRVTINAYYKVAGAAWQHCTALNIRRLFWVGVGRVSPNGVELVFQHQPRFIHLDQWPPKPPVMFSYTLVLENGVPRVTR